MIQFSLAPGRPIFYLCPFLVAATNITQYLTINGKSVDGVLWIGTLDRRMTGADKCTELWKMCLTEASRFGKWFCSICLSFELKSTIESNPAFHQNFCIRQYMVPEKHNNNNPLWKMDERYQDRERERIIFFILRQFFLKIDRWKNDWKKDLDFQCFVYKSLLLEKYLKNSNFEMLLNLTTLQKYDLNWPIILIGRWGLLSLLAEMFTIKSNLSIITSHLGMGKISNKKLIVWNYQNYWKWFGKWCNYFSVENHMR